MKARIDKEGVLEFRKPCWPFEQDDCEHMRDKVCSFACKWVEFDPVAKAITLRCRGGEGVRYELEEAEADA